MVFRDINPTTAGVPTDDIIVNFIRVIVTDKMECGVICRITKFLKHMIAPKGDPHKKHQNIVLQEMLAGFNKYKVELFDIRRYRANPRPELMALIEEYSRSHTVDTTLDSVNIKHLRVRDMRLLYHAECVEILALCCKGHRKATAAARCMSVIPFTNVVDVLSQGATYSCPPLAMAYGLFLRHVFLDSETVNLQIEAKESSVNIIEYKPMWETCSHFCAFAADGYLSGPFRPFVFEVALPCLQLFLVAYINEQTGSHFPDDDGNADIIILGTKRILACLLSEVGLTRNEMIVVSRAAAALGVRRGDYEPDGAGRHPSPSSPRLGDDYSTPESTTGMGVEMMATMNKGQAESSDTKILTSVLKSFRRKSGVAISGHRNTTEQTSDFIHNMAHNCPRIKKVWKYVL